MKHTIRRINPRPALLGLVESSAAVILNSDPGSISEARIDPYLSSAAWLTVETRRRLWLPVLAVAVVLVTCRGVHADQTAPGLTSTGQGEVLSIDVGIGRRFKVGCWTPISVTYAGDVSNPVQLAVWVPDPDGNLTKQPSTEVTLSGDGPHQLTSLFRTGRMDGVIRVDVESSGQILASRSLRVQADSDNLEQPGTGAFPPDPLDTQYWVVLGPVDGFQEAAQDINRRHSRSRVQSKEAVALIPLGDSGKIPLQPGALESVDVIVVSGSYSLDPSAGEAIRVWVEQGGHLVLCVSSSDDWSRLPCASWVPIRDVGDSRLRNLDVLRGPFPLSKQIPVGTVRALQFTVDDGTTIVRSLDGPLWARTPYRFGRVTLLGLEVSEPPLKNWETLPQLCMRLVDHLGQTGDKRGERRSAQLSHTGVSDLSTQLTAAVDQYPDQPGISSWATMGWIVVYLLLIGPLDYLLVHRLLRRPHWTWLTFPLMVFATAALAASSARQEHPTEVVSNQINLIDLDAGTGATRTFQWASFVSPESRRYRVQTDFINWWSASQTPEPLTVGRTLLGWTGIPETGFRGMYRAGGLDLAKPRYRFSPGMHAIEDVPVSIWSSYSTVASQNGEVPELSRLISCDLEGIGGQLHGTLTNRLNTPVDDWFIAYNNLVYFPRSPEQSAKGISINPGESISIPDTRIGVRTSRSFLTGVISERRQDAGTTHKSDIASRETYEPLSRDFDRIFRAISFYSAIGGREFTTLENEALTRLDLSAFLDLPRAVLFARVDATPAQLRLDGEPMNPVQSETYLRILLPVGTPK